MKKELIKIEIDNNTGDVSYELLEGFSGVSCENKASEIEVYIAGYDTEKKEYKSEYFNEDPGDPIKVLNK